MSRAKTTGAQGAEPPALGGLGSAAPQCGICCGNDKKIVECAKCNSGACIECIKKFIFEGTRKHASCMYCGIAFTKDLLFTYFPPSWMNEYKLYQRNFAIVRETSLLPSTIEIAAIEKEKRDVKKELDIYTKKYRYYTNVFCLIEGRAMNIHKNCVDFLDECRMEIDTNNAIMNYITHTDDIRDNFLYLFAKILAKIKNIPLIKNKDSNYYAAFLKKNNVFVIPNDADISQIHTYDRICEILQTIITIMSSGFYQESYAYNITTFNNYSITEIDYCRHCDGPICEITKKSKIYSRVTFVTRIMCISCGFWMCCECGGFAHANKCASDPITPKNFNEKYNEYIKIEKKYKTLKIANDNNNYKSADPSLTELGTKKDPVLFHCRSCNGYITQSSQGVCLLCNKKHCKICQEIKHDDTPCNDAIVENIKEIKNNTKPCPNCHVRVFRIEGCYQMFCTSCGTPFDWGSGKIIENETIHNPHYADYIKTLGYKNKNSCNNAAETTRNVMIFISKLYDKENYYHNWIGNGDAYDPRRNLYFTGSNNKIIINIPQIDSKFAKYNKNKKQLSQRVYPRQFIQACYSLCGEIEHIIANEPNYDKQFEQIRIDYLISDISKMQFDNKVGLLELQKEKIISMNLIYRNFVALMREYFATIDENNYLQYIEEMNKIWEITISAFIKLANNIQLFVEITPL